MQNRIIITFILSMFYVNSARSNDTPTVEPKPVFKIQVGNGDSIEFLHVSSDSKYLSGTTVSTSFILDTETGKIIANFLDSHNTSNVERMQPNALASRGAKYMIGGLNDRVQRWDLIDNSLSVSPKLRSGDNVSNRQLQVALSIDEQFAMAAWECKIIKLNPKSFKTTLEIVSESEIKSIRVTPDNKYVIGINNNTAKLWDSTSGKLAKTFRSKLDIVNYPERPSVFSNNTYIAFDISNGEYALWNIEQSKETYKGPGSGAIITPDSKYVLTVDENITVRDIKTLKIVKQYKVNNNGSRTDISPNGKFIAIGTVSGTVLIYRLLDLIPE